MMFFGVSDAPAAGLVIAAAAIWLAGFDVNKKACRSTSRPPEHQRANDRRVPGAFAIGQWPEPRW
jgi:Zn2+/Cd2+-exporting ATPase